MDKLEMIFVTKLEMKLLIIFHNAKTINGCRAGLMSLDKLERQMKTIEESDDIKCCMDFLWVKGNRMILEERR